MDPTFFQKVASGVFAMLPNQSFRKRCVYDNEMNECSLMTEKWQNYETSDGELYCRCWNRDETICDNGWPDKYQNYLDACWKFHNDLAYAEFQEDRQYICDTYGFIAGC